MIQLLLATAAALTIEDYATMPHLSTPRWSPDGAHIAYVVARADLARSVYEGDLWLVDPDGTHNFQLTREGNDAMPRWSPDGTRIAFLSDRAGTNQIWVIAIGGGEAQQLTKERTPVQRFEWSPDGRSIAFTRLDELTPDEEKRVKEKEDARVIGERRHTHLHVVEDGTVRRLTHGAFSIFTFSWMPDGSSIVFDRAPGTGLDDLFRTDIYSVSVRDGAVKAIVVRPGMDKSPVVSPDGKWIAFGSSAGTHDWLVEHDIHVVAASGGESRHVSKSYDRTAEAMQWSADSKTIWFNGPWNTTTQLFRVNADGSGFANMTNVDGVVSDTDVRGDRAVYVYQSLTEPPEIYVDGCAVAQSRGSAAKARRVTAQPRDRATAKCQLTHHNDAYRNRALGATRLIRWKNPKDGLEIEGLLTLPLDYQPGTRVPLLTFVHGGPASRFDQGFLGYHGATYAPHVLAANGFAVLRPNPRGTGGYGLAFRRANRNDWAAMPWIDIEAGIDKVIADGIADPKRMGLMGWSYGGYIVAWALGHSDRFRAVSAGAPVVDLLSFHGTTDIRDFIPHYFGHQPLSLERLRAQSPLWHLRKTNAKVLIQHGEADDRVPVSQGTMLYRILDELGTDVTMVAYPRSGHSLREPKLKIDVMRRNVEWFVKYVR